MFFWHGISWSGILSSSPQLSFFIVVFRLLKHSASDHKSGSQVFADKLRLAEHGENATFEGNKLDSRLTDRRCCDRQATASAV